MKALTIKQPWASLIAHGIKDIENRTWRTKYRGRIYIHSSAKPAFETLIMGLTEEQLTATHGYGLNPFHEFHKSAIIGEVDIIDCVLNHSSIWAEQMETYRCPETGINILQKGQKYVWNWVLANPILYDDPILNVKGKLSFWEYES